MTRAPVVFCVGWVAIAAGCSGGGEQGRDAGGVPVGMGRRSFVVTSNVTPRADGGPASVSPTTHMFTLVLDGDAHIAIAGAAGGGAAVMLQANADNSVLIVGPLRFELGCTGSVSYDSIIVAIDAGGRLSGNGFGQSATYFGDVGSIVSATMTMTGVADGEPPTFSSDGAEDLTDPFSSVSVRASEPLPPGVRPVLIDPDGNETPLLPASDESAGFVVSFYAPAALRQFGAQYRVTFAGVTDFAGNTARATDDLWFNTRPAPALVAEDGFESASGMLAGGKILTGTGAPTISGTRSLYIAPGNPMPGSSAVPLELRLPLAAGDTTVRFSYRTVNPVAIEAVRYGVGSVGGAVSWTTPAVDRSETTLTTLPDGESVFLGQLSTAELALPADAAGEVVLRRVAVPWGCAGLPPPPTPGIIIDDLRVE